MNVNITIFCLKQAINNPIGNKDIGLRDNKIVKIVGWYLFGLDNSLIGFKLFVIISRIPNYISFSDNAEVVEQIEGI